MKGSLTLPLTTPEVLLGILVVLASNIHARPTEVTGRAKRSNGANCGSCHGITATPSVAVMTNGTTTVVPDQAASFTVSVT